MKILIHSVGYFLRIKLKNEKNEICMSNLASRRRVAYEEVPVRESEAECVRETTLGLTSTVFIDT